MYVFSQLIRDQDQREGEREQEEDACSESERPERRGARRGKGAAWGLPPLILHLIRSQRIAGVSSEQTTSPRHRCLLPPPPLPRKSRLFLG